jgi:cold shock protein
MGRGHDWRPPRKRGFDDDNFAADTGPKRGPPRFGAPSARPMMDERPSGPPVRAKVKWFNGEKGFGFVELADGGGDAFLHLSVLQRAGQGPVQPGTSLQVRVSQGRKGAQISEVIEVDASTATATPAPRERSGFGDRDRGGGGGSPRPMRRERDVGATVEMRGTVKWFNATKGFGFVVVPEGGKDVFVHVSVLEQEGLNNLAEGQAVVMQVAQGMKGPEAVSLKLG